MGTEEDEGDRREEKADRDAERLSVSSVTTKSSSSSKTSRTSLVSRASKASSSAAAILRKGLSFSVKGPRSSTASVAAMVDLSKGDMCETIALVTVRQEESLESEVVAELQVGTTLDVVQIGEGRRIKVSFSAEGGGMLEGWVSSKTKLNEPLVLKCNEHVQIATTDFEVGGQHEVKAMVTLRAGEDLESDYICELSPGCTVKIVELGVHNKRRVKVQLRDFYDGVATKNSSSASSSAASSETTTGWISTTTKTGELLIGKVQDRGSLSKSNSFAYASNGSKVKAMLEAARAGNMESLRKLVEPSPSVIRFTSKPNLNASDVRGKTALIYAAAFGNKDTVEYLLTKREVDVNALDDTQKCALHHASKRNRCQASAPGCENVQGEIVTMLLNAGAYMEARDHNGCTALMFAVANGDSAVTKKLLAAQANVNVKDFEGHRPLDYAINFGHDDIVRCLKEHGAVRFDKYPGEADEDEGDQIEVATTTASVTTESTALTSATGAASSSGAAPADAAAAAAPAVVAEAVSGASPSASAASSPAASPKKKSIKKKASIISEAGGAAADGDGPSPAKPKAKSKKKAAASKEGDKEKKTKTKKGDKQAPSAAMLEALGEREPSAKEVKVAELPTEDVDLKTRALANLKAVMESDGSAGELEAAIKVAQSEGATEAELAEANKSLEALKVRLLARDRLRQDAAERDVFRLREAIARAEELGLTGPELKEAKDVFKEEEPKQKARDALREAQDSGETKKLKKALKAAKEAGLDPEEMAEYEELVAGAESKEKAEAALKAAVKELSVAGLKFAIQQAKEVGVEAAQIEKAEVVLREEEPKYQARQKLEEAIELVSGDKPAKAALAAAISDAKAAKLDEAEYAEAAAMLHREEEKERLLANVKEVLKETMTDVNMTDIDSVKAAKEKLSKAILEATNSGVKEVDLAEAELRRKKLHNVVEDLKGSIRVFCRIRPLSSKETEAGDSQITKQTDSMTIKVGEKPENTFRFDAVFTPGTQDEIFEDCRDLVQSAVDGYNVTLFAYGQTGAGKTFTMAGVPGQLGVSPRTIREVFDVIKRGRDRFEYTVMASMLELYKTELVDLLVKGNPAASKQKLQIRTDKTGAVTVEHLTEEECTCVEDLDSLVDRGTSARAVAATAMNSESSRSHLVTIVKIVSSNKETKEKLQGKLLIVDLAGSERLKKSMTSDNAQKESIEINKSLTALGDVIEALTKGQKSIPHRNHKLTQLMQDALGGSAKTLMFVNCSPANSNFEETVNSLKYAQRAKTITNNPAKKNKG